MSRFEFLQNTYAKVGLWGTAVAALCCFTPLLVWILAALGLAAFTAYLDYVLLPMLFLSVAALIYGYDTWQKNKSAKDCDISEEC